MVLTINSLEEAIEICILIHIILTFANSIGDDGKMIVTSLLHGLRVGFEETSSAFYFKYIFSLNYIEDVWSTVHVTKIYEKCRSKTSEKPLKNLWRPRTFQEPPGGFPEVFKCCPFNVSLVSVGSITKICRLVMKASRSHISHNSATA